MHNYKIDEAGGNVRKDIQIGKTMMEHFILLLLFTCIAVIKGDNTLGKTPANPATSCNEIYQHNNASRGTIGQYYIKSCHGPQMVTCNMKLKCGGIEGGWMQVVDVDMNEDDTCPGSWQYVMNPRKLCQGNVAGCSSAHFSAKGISYDHICGQVKAYQKGSMDAFNAKGPSIDSQYVDGISITIGLPRKHVWTYVVGLNDNQDSPSYNCPCAATPGPSAPAFVRDDYYCESGIVGTYDNALYYLTDPLWDGDGCTVRDGCCARIGMPWFHRTLTTSANEDFEIRLCKDQGHSDEDVAVEKLEIYTLSS